MALDTNQNPIVMDAAAQSVAGHVYIRNLVVTSGTGSGEFVLYSSSAKTHLVADIKAINAEDTVALGELGWVPGLYLDQLPEGGRVYVYID